MGMFHVEPCSLSPPAELFRGTSSPRSRWSHEMMASRLDQAGRDAERACWQLARLSAFHSDDTPAGSGTRRAPAVGKVKVARDKRHRRSSPCHDQLDATGFNRHVSCAEARRGALVVRLDELATLVEPEPLSRREASARPHQPGSGMCQNALAMTIEACRTSASCGFARSG
jgi:hypothetical protein